MNAENRIGAGVAHTDCGEKGDKQAALRVAIRLALVANALAVIGRAVNFRIIGLSPSNNNFAGFSTDLPLGNGDRNCLYNNKLSEEYLRTVAVVSKKDGELLGYFGPANSCDATLLEHLLGGSK